ncbi:glycosyltransferase family 2 protein [Primorskyibacter sp. S187A]|uniref:glycosyltransferase family 2 protein n=1 Tax=Primorskyibacter sp. S187A TaxID=3415130 RepID=UPI003C7C4C31
MSTQRLQLRGPETARLTPAYHKPLGQILVDRGVLDHEMLLHALTIADQVQSPLAQVCLSEGLATADEIRAAQAERFAAMALNTRETPADLTVASQLDPLFCLKHGVVPWMKLGDTTVLASASPDAFRVVTRALPEGFGPVLMGLAAQDDIEQVVAKVHGAQMAVLAETELEDSYSCRNMHILATRRQTGLAALGAALIGLGVFLAPKAFFIAAATWAIATLLLIAGMKLVALIARVFGGLRTNTSAPQDMDSFPTVSLLVPLYKETDIAGVLVDRLSRLTYPKSNLETLLVLEAEDTQTRETLRNTTLPPWMRVITVPPGDLTTKPRAMNYARRFARGEIIGVYDAEDSPAPDQIETIVSAFQRAPPEVACLQGVLDFYNPRMNWLARCFTIEYAAWFRILLPGLARIGMPIPLGGTTVFFRRSVLDELQGWDAFNVTEDADLGMRLARAGYRTELVDTVTLEEANCHLWPWVRQRSRWLKGYMITYLVHMRAPAQLWRQLGPGAFFGFQVFFLASLSQFALAPLLWSFWLAVAGFPHPVVDALPPVGFVILASLFVLTEVIGLVVGMTAVASHRHRHLIPWVPTLLFYFPLAAVATYKALWELLRKPFFWDKTTHGLSIGRTTIDH